MENTFDHIERKNCFVTKAILVALQFFQIVLLIQAFNSIEAN